MDQEHHLKEKKCLWNFAGQCNSSKLQISFSTFISFRINQNWSENEYYKKIQIIKKQK